jgi:hypothetical protein
MSRAEILAYLNDFAKQLAQLSRPHFPDVAAHFEAAEKAATRAFKAQLKHRQRAPYARERAQKPKTKLAALGGDKRKL